MDAFTTELKEGFFTEQKEALALCTAVNTQLPLR